LDDRQKRFLEKNFTKILGVFSCLLVSLLVVPYAFRHVEEEALSELKGHLSNLETHFGATPEKNTFEFSVDEFPSRTFLVGGLRAVDQSILTNNESIGSWMNFSVEKSSFKKNEGPIRVFQLSSQKNTYLTANDSALTAYKERIFSGLLVLIFLSVAMNLGFSLRDSYRTLKLESDRGNIDELLLAITKNPILSITGFCLVLIILNVVFLPRVVLLYSVLGTVLGYGYCIFWLRTRASSSPWLASIATRDEERRNHLSERLKTAAPKHV